MSRKIILYFGNISSKKGDYSTFMEYLAPKLAKNQNIITASNRRNPIFRMLHMIGVLLKNSSSTKIVLLDTYSGWAFYYALILATLSKLCGVSYIPILRGGNLLYRLKKSPFLSKLVFGFSKNNITPSRYLQEQFQLNGYDVEYIPNFIEIEKYPFKHRKICSPKLLWVRAFHEIYNPNMAIKVLAELSKTYPDVELCMVGPDKDGSMESCRALADEMGVLDKVTFTGMLPKTEWIELSQNFDIFINTTNLESFGVSVIEAAACGLPIVTTNVGELIYLYKDGEDALLVEKDDAHNMVKKITSIIEDKFLAENLSKQARKKAESFDWNCIKNYWLKLLG